MAEKTYTHLEGWEEYAQAVQAYGELIAESRAIGARLADLPKLQRQARDADDTAQATAMRAGEKDPGRKRSDALKAETEKAQTRLRVLSQAIEQQTAELDRLLAADEARDVAMATTEAARQRYADALEALLAAREDFWAAKRTQSWLTGELTKAMWNAPPPRLAIGLLPNGAMVSMNGTGTAGGLTGNGEPLDPAPVFQAMREEYAPQEPQAAQTGRWRTRQVVTDQGVPEGMSTEWVPDGAA